MHVHKKDKWDESKIVMQSNLNTILIVEDDSDLSLILQYALSKEGFNVFTAVNGTEALNLLEDWAIDLVVLDLNLAPDMDGKTVLRKMKQIRPRTKVIIMTGREDVESYIQTTQSGAIDYLIKPVSPKKLLCAIEKSLQLTK